MTSTRPTDPRLAAVAILGLPVAVALARADPGTWHPVGDHALLALGAWDVPGHLPLTGAWSRFGFHHPGPMLVILLAPFVRLLGAPGMLVGAAAINVVALGGCAVVLHRRGGRDLLWWGGAVLLVLVSSLGSAVVDPWNPIVTVLPFALVILLTWSCACGDARALPWLVVTASFVVQSHIAYAPTTAVLLVVALTMGAVHDRAAALGRSVRAGALAALLWLPALVEQATHDPGNLHLLADHLTRAGADTVGPSRAVSLLATELGALAPWLTRTEPLEAGGVAPSSPLLLVVPIVVGAACAWLARRAPEPRALLALVAAAWVATYPTVIRIEGPPMPYLLRWLWPVAALTVLALGWTLVDHLPPAALGVRALPGVTAVCALLALGSTWSASPPLVPESHDVAALLPAVEDLLGAAEIPEGGTVEIAVDDRSSAGDADGLQEALVAALTLRGHRAVGSADTVDRLGEHHTIHVDDGQPAMTLLVAAGDGALDEARRAAGREVVAITATSGPVAVFRVG